MKRVNVRGVMPIGDQVIEPVEIAITGHFGESLDELQQLAGNARGFKADAAQLLQTLRSLPGGTFSELLILMLQERASHFIVSFSEPKPEPQEVKPIDMFLFCPCCGIQHVDKAKPDVCEACGQNESKCGCATFTAWLNPPHKSHRCNFCNYVWRPADVPTNGVAALQSAGSRDADPVPRLTRGAVAALMEELEREQGAPYASEGYVNGIDFALVLIAKLAGINPDLKPKEVDAKGETR